MLVSNIYTRLSGEGKLQGIYIHGTPWNSSTKDVVNAVMLWRDHDKDANHEL